MKLKTGLFVIVATTLLGTQAVAGDASITGTIKYDGDEPNMKVLNMNADPKCAAKHKDQPAKAEMLVLGEGKTVANIFVRVKSGLPAGKTYETPTTPAQIDQLGCMYIPHVIAVMKGQTINILNSDGTLHNVHALPKVNAEKNVAMPAFKKKIDMVFDKVEDPFKIKCDVHPWMGGYVAVMDHPFYSVTSVDGKYTIKGLDPGEYEIEVWHEKLGVQTAKVTVAAGETKTQDFTVKKPTTVGHLDAVMLVK